MYLLNICQTEVGQNLMIAELHPISSSVNTVLLHNLQFFMCKSFDKFIRCANSRTPFWRSGAKDVLAEYVRREPVQGSIPWFITSSRCISCVQASHLTSCCTVPLSQKRADPQWNISLLQHMHKWYDFLIYFCFKAAKQLRAKLFKSSVK